MRVTAAGQGGLHLYVTGVSVGPDHHDEHPDTWGEDYRAWTQAKPHGAAVNQAQEKARFEAPTMGMDLGSTDDATGAMRHMMSQGGHPKADDSFVMKHSNPAWSQSQAFHSEGQPGVALHPDRWDYGTLAHEVAHHLHEHELGHHQRNDEEAHGPDFVRHYQNVLKGFGRGASETLGNAYEEALGRIRRTASQLDDGQQRALDRLAQLPDNLIQGQHAHRLFGEHNIRLHEEDPWEAGEAPDEHVTKDTGRSRFHKPNAVLHTSQDYLWRPTLEHFVRHPEDAGNHEERPSTWTHEGQHWINGGHHRILADRMSRAQGTEVSDRTVRTSALAVGRTQHAAVRREPVDMSKYFRGSVDEPHEIPGLFSGGRGVALDEHTWSKMPTEQVPLNGLHATQRRVFHKHLDRYRKGDDVASDGGDLPWVVNHEGRNWVLDGHHRVVDAVDRGQTHIEAHVMRPRFNEHTSALADGRTIHVRAARMPDVHRGIAVHLPADVHDLVHDESRPESERAEALMDHVTRGGYEPLGQHWSTDRKQAHHFSDNYAQGGHRDVGRQTKVIFHATHPEPHEIEHDEGWRAEHEVNDMEDEVPFRRGADVEVHGVSWQAHTPHGEPSQPWHHHTFADEQFHTALRRSDNPTISVRASRLPGNRVCPVCGGVGDEPDGSGSECMACDGSGGAVCPVCDQDVELHPLDGWQHLDGSISHNRSPLSVSEAMATLSARLAAFTPDRRIFAPTSGLDHRLWEGDHLRHDVSRWILATLDGFWRPLYGPAWETWARVYFAGSEASEWTSDTLEGNNDFDILVGVNYELAREHYPAFMLMADVQITQELNAQFREHLIPRTDPSTIVVDGVSTGPWSVTWYVNQDSWDIRDIKPYAAYNVSADTWAVKPPHLPEWSITDFPPAFLAEARAVSAYVEAVLALPEPMRSQQADALWRHLHSDRSRAFGAQGEGWFDPGNALEKWLDQAGLWEQLAEAHFAAVADPSKLLAPAGWSNDPATWKNW